jgi:hypothetical protein
METKKFEDSLNTAVFISKNYLILLLTILTVFSCNLNTKSRVKTTQELELDSTLFNTQRLIGEWIINGTISYNNTRKFNVEKGEWETISEEVEIVCAACPKIRFNTDNTAIIIFPNGKRERIKWNIKNRTIKIMYFEVTSDRAIEEGVYEMNFTQEKKSSKLELIQKDKNYSYILR